MAESWREQLEKKIAEINGAGEPSPDGTELVVDAGELSSSQINTFLSLSTKTHQADRVNNRTFCGAAPGTLTMSFPYTAGNKTLLRIVYAPQPPPDFVPDKGLKHPAPPGRDVLIRTGFDFDSLP